MITPTQLNEPPPFHLLSRLNFNVMMDKFVITSVIKRCIARSSPSEKPDRWCTRDTVIRDIGRFEVAGLYG
jgi:hypothetical protein